MLNDNTNISPSAIFKDSDKHVEDNEVTTIKPPAEIKTLPKDTSFLNKTVKSTPKPVASSTAQKSSMGKLQKATLTKIPCDLNSTEPFGVTSCISEQLADEKVSSEGIDTSAPVPGTTYRITPSTSKNTVSTLKSLTNGELPIEADHIELVWGCVCISAKKTQEVILRNKSQNVLQLKITSSNASFRIVNCQTDPELKLVLSITLYPLELRRFSVIFTPTAIGAEVGELIFSPISTELQQQQTKRQRLMLYGYGGHANVKIENVMGVSNKLYLSLGKFENRSQIIQKFTVHDAGSVPAFVCTSFVSKTFYLYSKVTVFPTESVLPPKERIVVTVTYAPTKKDAEHFFLEFPYSSMKMGYIQLITGEEPVRGRIRRLCCKLKQEPGMACNTVQERLSGVFPNEIMPPDLTRFTETVGAM